MTSKFIYDQLARTLRAAATGADRDEHERFYLNEAARRLEALQTGLAEADQAFRESDNRSWQCCIDFLIGKLEGRYKSLDDYMKAVDGN